MSNRLNATLTLFLCLITGSLTACSLPGEEVAIADSELAQRRWPMIQAAESASHALRNGPPPTAPTAGQNTPSVDLTKRWLRWALGQPWHPGPITDMTGAHCGMGQDGPVWFLAGTFFEAPGPAPVPVTRHCTIPAGKQLYFPLINSWWLWWDWELEFPENMEMSAAWFDYVYAHTCTLTLRLDGEEVVAGGFDTMVERLWVNTYEPFDVVVNQDNYTPPEWGIFGPMFVNGGGHYARMQPLTPGDHVLELGGSHCDGEVTWVDISVTYHLHVGE